MRSLNPTILICCLLIGLALSGCEEGSPPQTTQHYTVRGQIVALPTAEHPRRLSIRHEAIDGFVNDLGEKVGMDAMTMPFDLAPEVKTDELAVGDKVEFEYRVDWKNLATQIESIRKLPAETELIFRRAQTP